MNRFQVKLSNSNGPRSLGSGYIIFPKVELSFIVKILIYPSISSQEVAVQVWAWLEKASESKRKKFWHIFGMGYPSLLEILKSGVQKLLLTSQNPMFT
jgi:hypothetical protein